MIAASLAPTKTHLLRPAMDDPVDPNDPNNTKYWIIRKDAGVPKQRVPSSLLHSDFGPLSTVFIFQNKTFDLKNVSGSCLKGLNVSLLENPPDCSKFDYFVWVASGWNDEKCGGCMALWNLARRLKGLGCNVYVTPKFRNPWGLLFKRG